MEEPVGPVGHRDIGHDPVSDATPETDRFASQMLVLLGSHSGVRPRETLGFIAAYLTSGADSWIFTFQGY